MTMLRVGCGIALSALISAGCFVGAAAGQDFAQPFDVVGTDSGNGPANLLAEGYEFRRVIDAGLTHVPWRLGPWFAGAPAPQQGAGYLYGALSVPAFASGNFTKWIILPAIPGQSAGKVASV